MRSTVHAITATATAIITGIGSAKSPWRRRSRTQLASTGTPTSRKTLSLMLAASSPCSRSWIIRRPPHAGQFQPVSNLNRHGGYSEFELCGSTSPM
ncbi:Uncharacterised protein [Mycobacterium tuberculosis]|nr:Uncharacterised protein [Mycobacterium tuberculosis]